MILGIIIGIQIQRQRDFHAKNFTHPVKFLALKYWWTFPPKIICINKSCRDQEVAPTEETTHNLTWTIHYKVRSLNHDTFVVKFGDRNPGINGMNAI